MSRVLAIAEQRDGALKRISAEVVTAARKVADGIGGEVDVMVVGAAGIGEAARALGRYGADRVVAVEDEALGAYSPESYTRAIVERAQAEDYFAVLFPATAPGRDLAPRVAARLDMPLASDVTELEVEGGELVIRRPVYAGKAFVDLTLEASPRLVSVRSNAFRARENARDVALERAEVAPEQTRVRVREVHAGAGDKPDVAEATTVVAGGRGLKDPDNWKVLEELADALGDGVALGASRAVVDAGWRPHSEQVGQTGKTVSPKLYFAVAISGAIQHLAGMRTASTIVAINKDRDAPIFKVADYGIVGDAFEVVPRLAEEIRNLQG
jgi:electron transfer flavoprotein alpha subunit